MRPPIARAAWICAAAAVAGAVTAVEGAGWIALSELAATPRAIARGKLWLLFTSGVVADRPWLPSLLGFAIVGFAALSVAPPRIVVAAAVAGHVLSTLVVYGFLGAAAALDAHAFASLLDTPDVGLSAIIAAWIGLVAYELWRRHPSRRAHVLDAVGCLGCASIGLAFRPDVTALDSEHLVAFALGVVVAGAWPGAGGSSREAGAKSHTRRRAPSRSRLDRRLGAAGGITARPRREPHHR